MEARAKGVGSSQWVLLDMDSSESPVYAKGEQSDYSEDFGLLSPPVSVQQSGTLPGGVERFLDVAEVAWRNIA